jgi:flagellar biosynthesis/type III secretory pathway protein FliH
MKVLYLFLFFLIVVLLTGVCGCENNDDAIYKSGFQEGYTQGRNANLADVEKVIEANATETGYKTGYQKGYADGQISTQQTIQNTKDVAYKDGYNLGYKEGQVSGYQTGKIAGYQEGQTAGYQTGYKAGYQKGFDESTALLQPQAELVKILTYKLTRDYLDWLTVPVELQNISNKTLDVTVTCALLDSNGAIVATSQSFTNYQKILQPQQTDFFTFVNFFKQPQAVDARFTLAWQ